MIITICSSASFYRDIFAIKDRLEKMGHIVLIPLSAEEMRARGDFENKDFDPQNLKRWLKDPSAFARKTFLMKKHLEKVKEGDVVLVFNLEKKGMPGYVGGNVLLEMFHGWTHGKPIYIFNPVSPDLPLYEEVMGMNPICIEGNLAKILQGV